MASEASKAVIILMRAMGHDGLNLLKLKMKRVTQILSVSQCSSVYLVQAFQELGAHVHDLRSQSLFSGYLMAVKGFTPRSLEEFAKSLEDLTKNESNAAQHEFSAQILCFGQETKMTPELTVPDAEFHMFPEMILPAAEVSPEFHHPVLRKTFREIAASLPKTDWGEFVAQGKAMLDF